MKILKASIASGLLLLNLLTILLILVVVFSPSSIARIILGIPFVLFTPGYTLMLVLYPRKGGLDGVERVALSFGLSITVVPLVGLILNYTPWGIKLPSILYGTAAFIFIMSAIAWFRRRRLPETERFSIGFRVELGWTWHRGIWDRTLSVILVLAVMGTLGTVAYVAIGPKASESFTEFYILGPSGNAADYPSQLKVGEEGKVIVGIANHERDTVTYQVEVKIGGVENNEVGPIVLKPGDKWEREVAFVPKVTGENQQVEFLLYKNAQLDPDIKPLHLWIGVVE
jgi:uncharacterized membrane protein